MAVCCIYHAPRAVGETSSESSSESDSESSSSSSGESGYDDDETARMAGGDGKVKKGRRRRRRHRHGHEHGEDHEGCEHASDVGKGRKKAKRKSANAYEKMPKVKGGAGTVVEVKS